MDYEAYRTTLEEERAKLEAELSQLGTRDPKTPDTWDVKAPAMDVMQADENEAADRTEEVHIDSIVLDELEARYRLVCAALDKVAAGTYGTCEVCGRDIEEDRLNANPAARTCKSDLENESIRA